jgi:D-serine deaminase-like pyridoxal phosphate-dependent protein
MRVSDLDTPALIIDLDIMHRNLSRAADYARSKGLRFRPHTKTHKIPALARLQIAMGAAGVTVAKTTEAEVMMKAEPPELLVAYPVLGAAKTQRLAELAGKTRLSVSIDSVTVARAISSAAVNAGVEIGVLLEIDAGLHRVGVTTGEALRQLALEVTRLKGLRFEGIAFYPGHIKQLDPVATVALTVVERELQEASCTLARIGLKPEIVSGGSTPALFISHVVRSMNEIRPGTYIFNDRNTVYAGACGWEDCAAFVLTTVASTSVKDRVILDAGSKTFSSDQTSRPGFGIIVDAPDAHFEKMNEEHGFVDTARCSRRWRAGEKVRVIPNHICVAMNLQERVYGIRGGIREGEVEEVWEVEARGKLQ